MNFVLIGPQGSGKGVQASFLAKKYKIPAVSVGQLYRQQIRKKTSLGQKVQKYVLNGDLVPDHFTVKLLRSELSEKKYAHGVILDGFPRDMIQTKFLEKILKVDKVILLNISQAETIKRLSRRRVCDCGETYHLSTKNNKLKLVCGKCGRVLKQRQDDTPKAIKERLKIYNQRTKPVIKYYKKQGKVIKINGEGSIPDVRQMIFNALRK